MRSQKKKNSRGNPWSWVPSLYFIEGIPYTVVMVVSVVMYKMLGISNTDIALYTSLLYLPWVLKPLWSPIVDNLKTKRWWILIMQFILGVLFACIALTIPTTNFFRISIAFLWLMAFTSATHDIAADGFYMIGLEEGDQSFFNGIRSAFYRVSMLMGQGVFVILVSILINASGMDTIEIEVNAVPEAQAAKSVLLENIDMAEHDGDMRLIYAPEVLDISLNPVSPAYADSVIKSIRAWNLAQGQPDPDAPRIAKEKTRVRKEKPLRPKKFEQWLRMNFGVTEVPVTDYAGNIGIVSFHLSKAPDKDKTVIVTFGQDRGDKSIKLVEGTRFEFNEENWNKPVQAGIQLDKKLLTPSSAVFDAQSGNVVMSWTVLFFFLSAMLFIFWLAHRITLPKVETDRKEKSAVQALKDFLATFASFFTKESIGLAITFLLLFRLGESQLVKLSAPFMLDTREAGGLGLTAGQYGLTYGTVGVIFLTLGGILGGMAVAKHGLKKWIWWFAIMINVPNAVYIFLSYVQPSSLWVIVPCVSFETFGYGFGFTAYMMYMIYISKGEYKTSHYAICTAFMALGMMIPGMMSGWLQEIIGYEHFFIWVVIATIPGFILIKFLKIDPEFGKKVKKTE
ncbi:MAG: MFS transporter [Candidatus Marinimicrobia bacterium]|jgi:PAT family beta-lactamase induction signal transducer AmpG|nr:MFS transporter [Candidatus Neomarinimicrobiota bacterium]MDD5709543.1 MFS transporter [Candidatus Neomarinimicrobiota bacterium]MDX9777473.1 MFS transporter [bacterium]